MNRNVLICSRHLGAASFPDHLLAAAAALLLSFAAAAHARLSPEDLAAITKTGLVPLTGEQEGEYDARDYVVVETMKIKRGDSVKFGPGTNLFIHEKAKVTINGSLSLEGTSSKPVKIGRLPFTLPRLSSDSRIIFDSTSIFVYRSGCLSMVHTVFTDSSIRISVSDSSGSLAFRNITGSGNRVTLPDTTLVFPARLSVKCGYESGILSDSCIPPPDPDLDADTRWFPEMKPLTIVRIGLGIGTIAAVGVWIKYNAEAKEAYEGYYSKDTPSPPEAERLRRRNHSSVLYRNLAAIAGVCGAASISITFVIGGKSE